MNSPTALAPPNKTITKTIAFIRAAAMPSHNRAFEFDSMVHSGVRKLVHKSVGCTILLLNRVESGFAECLNWAIAITQIASHGPHHVAFDLSMGL
jgi:hypothetical protein